MPLSLEIINNLCGFSLAKYSTWFYYKPDHLLFDAGEGISIYMRNMIYGIKYVLLSHGHGDHIGGIPGLLRSRASSMGDRDKPISIYYPKSDRNVMQMYKNIKESIGKLPFEIEWKEMVPGDTISLAGNRTLEAFASRHIENTLTLGYRIVEYRMRLKSIYRDLPTHQLMELIQSKGKKEVSETYKHTLLCFSGDSMPLDKEFVANAEVLLHDATFLKTEDRDEDTHATVEEVFQLATETGISSLAIFHLSARYRNQEIIEEIQACVSKYKVTFPVFYMMCAATPFSLKKSIIK